MVKKAPPVFQSSVADLNKAMAGMSVRDDVQLYRPIKNSNMLVGGYVDDNNDFVPTSVVKRPDNLQAETPQPHMQVLAKVLTEIVEGGKPKRARKSTKAAKAPAKAPAKPKSTKGKSTRRVRGGQPEEGTAAGTGLRDAQLVESDSA